MSQPAPAACASHVKPAPAASARHVEPAPAASARHKQPIRRLPQLLPAISPLKTCPCSCHRRCCCSGWCTPRRDPLSASAMQRPMPPTSSGSVGMQLGWLAGWLAAAPAMDPGTQRLGCRHTSAAGIEVGRSFCSSKLFIIRHARVPQAHGRRGGGAAVAGARGQDEAAAGGGSPLPCSCHPRGPRHPADGGAVRPRPAARRTGGWPADRALLRWGAMQAVPGRRRQQQQQGLQRWVLQLWLIDRMTLASQIILQLYCCCTAAWRT
jgi:hypothetical protein